MQYWMTESFQTITKHIMVRKLAKQLHNRLLTRLHVAFIVGARVLSLAVLIVVVGLGHRKYSWVFAFNKDLVLDQQFILSARWSACSRYIEFRSLRISELSCTHYNENAGKPWIRQSFFRQCFKLTISPKFCTAKVLFYTVSLSEQFTISDENVLLLTTHWRDFTTNTSRTCVSSVTSKDCS